MEEIILRIVKISLREIRGCVHLDFPIRLRIIEHCYVQVAYPGTIGTILIRRPPTVHLLLS